ncbi:antitoxin [Salicibibacter cibi]|uniref:Antitoxin n=1 Tax=Salicibibacter cibi TaxID=2743001 RepID=A0A7T7CFC9_9BACI|nr:antitoxin [Salicibibacter cibi]QQK79968.1 antitoxin [Salicibibacter cibi]
MQSEKISVPLTDELFSEIRHLSENEQNQFFHQLVKRYIERRKKEHLRAELKEGYMEMAELNLSIAESFVYAESEALFKSESNKHGIQYNKEVNG